MIMSRRSIDSLQAASKALAQHDFTLWGERAAPTARERLGWLDLPELSRDLLPALDALSAWARSVGRNRFVLSGMGGSSLAPEVIAATYGSELILLDSTHPQDVRAVLEVDPLSTLFIISSKSGETIETLSHLKAIEARLESAHAELAEHVIVITDPGSPLAGWATEHNVRLFQGDPTVGGRFSALSIFGLLPASLLGVDCAMLLDDAADMKFSLSESREESLALRLVVEILREQPFLNLPATPLSDWIEQLVAESTGKDGTGIIPVISKSPQLLATVAETFALPLGAAFYLWEWATALLGYALEVNPFDQPDVAQAKAATQEALTAQSSGYLTSGTSGVQMLHSGAELHDFIARASTTTPGYLALLCFTPMRSPEIVEELVEIREALAQSASLHAQRVTLGCGPRYLHSTGQCHKGGPKIGSFVVITLDEASDYPIPHSRYGFSGLLQAQVIGELRTLHNIGRPVVHAHLTRAEVKEFSRALRATS